MNLAEELKTDVDRLLRDLSTWRGIALDWLEAHALLDLDAYPGCAKATIEALRGERQEPALLEFGRIQGAGESLKLPAAAYGVDQTGLAVVARQPEEERQARQQLEEAAAPTIATVEAPPAPRWTCARCKKPLPASAFPPSATKGKDGKAPRAWCSRCMVEHKRERVAKLRADRNGSSPTAPPESASTPASPTPYQRMLDEVFGLVKGGKSLSGEDVKRIAGDFGQPAAIVENAVRRAEAEADGHSYRAMPLTPKGPFRTTA